MAGWSITHRWLLPLVFVVGLFGAFLVPFGCLISVANIPLQNYISNFLSCACNFELVLVCLVVIFPLAGLGWQLAGAFEADMMNLE